MYKKYIYIYTLAIDGKMAEPYWLTFVEEKLDILFSFFFKIWFYSKNVLSFFLNLTVSIHQYQKLYF